MANCNTKRWKFPHYFRHYFYTYGKCTKTRELKWFLFLFFSRETILSHSYDQDIANLQTPIYKNWFGRFN